MQIGEAYSNSNNKFERFQTLVPEFLKLLNYVNDKEVKSLLNLCDKIMPVKQVKHTMLAMKSYVLLREIKKIPEAIPKLVFITIERKKPIYGPERPHIYGTIRNTGTCSNGESSIEGTSQGFLIVDDILRRTTGK